ncbi:hypothetical protein CYY_003159 [Polysphondylium violaceum]|uniref:F-box domain-containing protein n=1 Tax=Polysphondylium violaceum TaxID=133409 RepID=A0A8J4PX07_9MYCE|nr:hypothetical protein CYY_003159 [Polysphondylium violaceum]
MITKKRKRNNDLDNSGHINSNSSTNNNNNSSLINNNNDNSTSNTCTYFVPILITKYILNYYIKEYFRNFDKLEFRNIVTAIRYLSWVSKEWATRVVPGLCYPLFYIESRNLKHFEILLEKRFNFTDIELGWEIYDNDTLESIIRHLLYNKYEMVLDTVDDQNNGTNHTQLLKDIKDVLVGRCLEFQYQECSTGDIYINARLDAIYKAMGTDHALAKISFNDVTRFKSDFSALVLERNRNIQEIEFRPTNTRVPLDYLVASRYLDKIVVKQAISLNCFSEMLTGCPCLSSLQLSFTGLNIFTKELIGHRSLVELVIHESSLDLNSLSYYLDKNKTLRRLTLHLDYHNTNHDEYFEQAEQEDEINDGEEEWEPFAPETQEYINVNNTTLQQLSVFINLEYSQTQNYILKFWNRPSGLEKFATNQHILTRVLACHPNVTSIGVSYFDTLTDDDATQLTILMHHLKQLSIQDFDCMFYSPSSMPYLDLSLVSTLSLTCNMRDSDMSKYLLRLDNQVSNLTINHSDHRHGKVKASQLFKLIENFKQLKYFTLRGSYIDFDVSESSFIQLLKSRDIFINLKNKDLISKYYFN